MAAGSIHSSMSNPKSPLHIFSTFPPFPFPNPLLRLILHDSNVGNQQKQAVRETEDNKAKWSGDGKRVSDYCRHGGLEKIQIENQFSCEAQACCRPCICSSCFLSLECCFCRPQPGSSLHVTRPLFWHYLVIDVFPDLHYPSPTLFSTPLS